MKLSGAAATRFFAKPDKETMAVLLFGADPVRIASRRKTLINALIGEDGIKDMRLSRLSGKAISKDPAALNDALKAEGFFPGPRAVLLDEASDSVSGIVEAACEDWNKGDAVLIVEAGALRAASKLRKFFEKTRLAFVIGIYDDPPDVSEIENLISGAGLGALDPKARTDLLALGREMAPGDFVQFVEKLALFKLSDVETPVTSDDIVAVLPGRPDAAIDELIHAVAEAQKEKVVPIIQRLLGQGISAPGICSAATRHFRALHTIATDPGGGTVGIGKLRPPIYGPARNRMLRQAQNWGGMALEKALQQVIETDLTLRSAGQTAPQMALVERTLIRLSMMPRR